MTDTLTRARIEALARANAATEGPWTAGDPQPFMPGAQIRLYAPGWVPIRLERTTERHVLRTPDAELIAASRSDVPAMAVALLAVLDLHEPETVTVMAQSAPEDYVEWPLVDVSVCSHCLPEDVRDQIDNEEADESDVRHFQHPARPCGRSPARNREVMGHDQHGAEVLR